MVFLTETTATQIENSYSTPYACLYGLKLTKLLKYFRFVALPPLTEVGGEKILWNPCFDTAGTIKYECISTGEVRFVLFVCFVLVLALVCKYCLM